MISGALLLDAGMRVQAAARRLAQHGYWIDVDQPDVRYWLEEFVAKINGLASKVDTKSASTPDRARTIRTTAMTVGEAARLLARPADGQWCVIRRQQGITIFWYARSIPELLKAFSQAFRDQTVSDALNLHEYTSTPSARLDDISPHDTKRRVVLCGHDSVGIEIPEPKEKIPHLPEFALG